MAVQTPFSQRYIYKSANLKIESRRVVLSKGAASAEASDEEFRIRDFEDQG